MASVSMSIRTDSELKKQTELVLSQLGLTMSGAINMFMSQIVRDQAVPLSLSLGFSTKQSLPYDLEQAQADRDNGYMGKDAWDTLSDMRDIITRAESKA